MDSWMNLDTDMLPNSKILNRNTIHVLYCCTTTAPGRRKSATGVVAVTVSNYAVEKKIIAVRDEMLSKQR